MGSIFIDSSLSSPEFNLSVFTSILVPDFSQFQSFLVKLSHVGVVVSSLVMF